MSPLFLHHVSSLKPQDQVQGKQTNAGGMRGSCNLTSLSDRKHPSHFFFHYYFALHRLCMCFYMLYFSLCTCTSVLSSFLLISRYSQWYLGSTKLTDIETQVKTTIQPEFVHNKSEMGIPPHPMTRPRHRPVCKPHICGLLPHLILSSCHTRPCI
jgi:hypothetical protein